MQLHTKDYGVIDYEEKDLFFFPDGLFGFSQVQHFLPLCLNEEEDSTILLLHGVEDPNLAFVVINPFTLDPDYAPTLTEEELSYLGVKSAEELSYYVTCGLREDSLSNTVNLKCPLVINPENHKGMQVILESSGYDYKHTLGSFASVQEKKAAV